jgi:hypothetical protein
VSARPLLGALVLVSGVSAAAPAYRPA